MLAQIAEMQWRHEREEYAAFCQGRAEGYYEARERFKLETAHLRQLLEYTQKKAVEALGLKSTFYLISKDDKDVHE